MQLTQNKYFLTTDINKEVGRDNKRVYERYHRGTEGLVRISLGCFFSIGF